MYAKINTAILSNTPSWVPLLVMLILLGLVVAKCGPIEEWGDPRP